MAEKDRDALVFHATNKINKNANAALIKITTIMYFKKHSKCVSLAEISNNNASESKGHFFEYGVTPDFNVIGKRTGL